MTAKRCYTTPGGTITARAEPLLIEKHGRGVVVVVAVEEFERLSGKSAADRRSAKDEKKN
ncbi:hypothetisches protein [mine drainage metagenome]|uniref:Hypothetisches protein n=1 Tax=mine drainage metagenome TaxID=410659 RepID=A0A1J5S2Q0_9ZZZZ